MSAPPEVPRGSAEQLRLALEAGEMGTWEWRIGDGHVTWSEALERMHGLQPGTFGGTFADYKRDVHPDDLAMVYDAVSRTLAGEEHRLRYRIIRPDGAVRWLDARGTLLRDAAGLPHTLVGICSDITDRRHAAASVQLLADAGTILHASLDFEATIAAVTHLALPGLADYCVFDLVEDGKVRRVAATHADLEAQGLVDELQKFPPDLQSDGLVASAIRSGEPSLIRDWTSVAQSWSPTNDAHKSLVERLRPRSMIVIPLRGGRGDMLGALTFVLSSQDRYYDSTDLELARALGTRAASAIENARLYRTVAEAGQQLRAQARELEEQAQQMQDQAVAMETQQVEMEQQTHALQAANEALHQTNVELDAARANAVNAHAYVTGILGAITDPFVVYDQDWRFQYMNDAAVDVFTSTGVGGRATMLGRVLWEMYPDIIGTRFEAEMRRASEDRVPVMFEELNARRGQWSEVRCYPLPLGGIAAIWKNTTEKKRADERLHFLSRASAILSSSLHYRTTVAQVAQLLVPQLADWCGIQLLDEHGELQQLAVAHSDPEKVNWAWELDKRYPVDMRAAAGVPNVLRTGKSELYPQITDEMLVGGAVDAEHLALLRQLGMESVLLVPLVSRSGVIGVISLISAESGRRFTAADQSMGEELAERAALAIDNARLFTATADARAAIELSRAQLEQVVAEMRRTNSELTEKTYLAEEARSAAEQANRVKSDFLAHMSHELRTPLNAIAGYADLMQLGIHGELTPHQRDDLERIKRAQRLLLGHINDVLNFAKVDAGHIHYEIRPFPLRDVVNQLDVLVEPQLAARSLRYDGGDIPDSLMVCADEEKVRQILVNLLSNATKFTLPGGRVSIRAAQVNDAVCIEVSDTGVGIPADKLDTIFDPFVQLERTLSSSHQGTGLGLAISRDLARGMAGQLTVESVEGRGSTFSLTLPAWDASRTVEQA
jgi:PAS domain S-box-containing protein